MFGQNEAKILNNFTHICRINQRECFATLTFVLVFFKLMNNLVYL